MASSSEIYYGRLDLGHKAGMMALCKRCFPVDYPEHWYDNLLKHSPTTYTHGAFDIATGQLVGIIVGQIQRILEAEDEVGTLLESVTSNDDKIVYITIFGGSQFSKSCNFSDCTVYLVTIT